MNGRTTILVLGILSGLLLVPGRLRACLNDRDTLAEETQALPDVAQIITGRFVRNPPLYYVLRLKRVAGELQAKPALLDDYDDAGVACDRLGRDDEAIGWMEKKRVQLLKADPHHGLREAWYRYNANIGTFRVHRWIRAGGDRERIGEVIMARDNIAAAIKIKPGAHLGREKYQLQVMNWIISPQIPPAGSNGMGVSSDRETPVLLADYLSPFYRWRGDAVQGLSGLIVLGSAWESPDIFAALSRALKREWGHDLARMAAVRGLELINTGHRSLASDPSGTAALKEELQRVAGEDRGMYGGLAQGDADYKMLRAEAERWQARRTAYMMGRLQAGRHPDTDPAFWHDYHDPGPPHLTIPWDRQADLVLRGLFGYQVHLLNFSLFVFLVGLLLYTTYRRHRAAQRRRRLLAGRF